MGCLGGSSVKRLALDFGSGHGLTVREFEPRVGLCAGGVDPAWDSLSPSVSAPTCACSLFLSLSKINIKKKISKQNRCFTSYPLCLHEEKGKWPAGER